MNATADKLSVRNRLLETANRLFYEHGYLATGINEVIKEAGIAKASFYHHFKTKEDLLVVTLEQRHDRMMAEVREVVSQGQTPGEKIARLFEWLGTQCSCGSKSKGCAYLNMVSEFRDAGCKVREVVRWHKDSFRKFLQELISAHYRGQSKTEDELEEAADELYLLIEAVFAASPVHQCTWPAETAFRIANDRFKLV
ncbi:MAG: TetR/AcrR family transcriptional regulator [Planctomycetes bacterium]|nr:TetR/AcrR family transcriptional regulator [Planctomycetota bacterium]MCW8136767.1 TetR/AcrR family transcriptional regulator [Planctomycetota bacterium]